jgi:hypothetical protein
MYAVRAILGNIISMVLTMRQVTIAIAALLISPLVPAAPAQHSGDAAREQAVEALLYHQVVHDDGISLGLVTDPRGVDFRSYLTQILSKLKPRWGETWPVSSGDGDPRRVVIEGAISRDGTLSKLVFRSPSLRSVGGALGVDRESLPDLRRIAAALSSANPLPPLSGDFKGDEIIVQFTFTPKRR